MNWNYAIVWLSLFLTSVVHGQNYVRYTDLNTYPKDSVRAIEITKVKLKEFPIDLSEYKNLEHLVITKVPMANMAGLEKLTQLKTLKLDKLDLAYFPIEITQLVNLESLIVSRVEFAAVPKQIERLQKLKYLDLYGSVITSLPEEIQNLTELKRLNLTGISFTPQEQKVIKEMLPAVKIKMDAPCNCMSH